ncbi:sugar-binding protein [Bacillus sp. FJAT-49732]|uniref:Sugar-binding protein n=1 Tax=Lederbergia citrisecunda TaxID=2833583 RepID=A0A942TU41_9BACI|nr:sugar-binding protein [Lederbergia citrisecunda]MBS4202224.1 sugar-binding protein [Lederbergia citrisecunda]
MKRINFLYIFLGLCICLSLGLAAFFLFESFQYEASFNGNESIPNYDYHFVLIGQEKDNPYHRKIYEGATAAAKEKNIFIEYVGPRQTNVEEHIKLIEMATAARVDGILTQGLTNREFKPAIDNAINRGVPVITFDTDLEDSKRLSYIGTDNYESGYKIGEALIEDTNGQAVVGIITGLLYSNNLVLRVQGFLDAIEKAPNIKVVAIESSNISKSQAAEKAHQMLRKYPEITAFFGTSALDGAGIAQAIDKINPITPILVYAFDDLNETLELIKEDKIHATVKQNQYEMGYKGVSMLYEAVKGERIPKTYHTSTKILRKKDIGLSNHE